MVKNMFYLQNLVPRLQSAELNQFQYQRIQFQRILLNHGSILPDITVYPAIGKDFFTRTVDQCQRSTKLMGNVSKETQFRFIQFFALLAVHFLDHNIPLSAITFYHHPDSSCNYPG